jgi:hypothetical protein
VAQEAQDQLGADAELGMRARQARCRPTITVPWHAARGVGLRVEEELGVHHVVGRGALEVGPGHVEEVGSCSSTLAPA